jgi:hypothetical protein
MIFGVVAIFLIVLWLFLSVKSLNLGDFMFSAFVLNIALDMAQSPELAGMIALMRAGFFYIFIVVHYARTGLRRLDIVLIFLVLYTLIGIMRSSDVEHSARFAMRVFIPLILVSLAFRVKDAQRVLARLRALFPKALIIFIIYVMLSNIFGFGVSTYGSDSFLSGYLFGSDLHLISLMTIVTLTTLGGSGSLMRRYIELAASAISTVLLVFTLRRLSPLIVVMGVAFMNTGSVRTVFSRLLPSVIILGLAFFVTVNSQAFLERMEVRADKMAVESLEGEMRYQEIGIIYEEVLMFRDVPKSLFGFEMFNSMGNYGGGMYLDRMIHVDYFTWLHGGGVVGLLIYLIFLFAIPFLFRMPLKDWSDENVRLFWFMFLIQFVISVSGQMYIISFRSFIFIYLGLLAAAYHQKKQNERTDHLREQE